MTEPISTPFFYAAIFIGDDADKANIPYPPLLSLFWAQDTTTFYVWDGSAWQATGGGGSGIAAWGQVSTAQYTGSGSPVGSITPDAAGDIYLDTTGPGVWQATGVTSADWQQVGIGTGGDWGQATTAHFSGSGSPVTVVTPSAIGDLYVDTTTPGLWQANGLTNTDWQDISGGGSLPSWFLFGTGSPVGVVTPPSTLPALYFDVSQGGLYSNNDGSDTGWISVGGVTDQTAPGLYSDTVNAFMIVGPSGTATITDETANGFSGNGLFWQSAGTDGDQQLAILTGPSGSGFLGVLQDPNGNLKPGNTIDVSGIPTANPGPGLLWNNAGVLAIGT